MRVYDVEARSRVAVSQLACRARERSRAGSELVQLDLDTVKRAQRGHLIAYEAAALGMPRVGQHVGDHERAQDASTVALWNDGARAQRSR